MQLCLDVGNSHIVGGVFHDGNLLLTFRHNTQHACTSDQIGLFVKTLLRENAIDPTAIAHIAIGSVVPAVDYTLRAACIKYFGIAPFILQAGVKTGLKIKCQNPLEVGADLIAGAIAAIHQLPNKPLIIIDFGTATTCCAVTAHKEFLGVAIMPGIRLAMESLQNNTAKLFPVEIITPETAVGKSTKSSLQSGLYYMQLGAIKELVDRFREEVFPEEKPIILGTGGFSHLFAQEKLFHAVVPELVLRGLHIALNLNMDT